MKKITLDIQNGGKSKKIEPPTSFQSQGDAVPSTPTPSSTTSLNNSISKKPNSKNKVKTTDPKKAKRKKILISVAIIAILILGACGFFLYRTNRLLNVIGISTNPSSTVGNILTQKDPELIKDENNRTNALIAGIDTRPSNPGLQNTDSIIVASYDHDTNEAVMISIPRDMWVGYPDNPTYFTKVNGIYNYCEAQEEGTGLECLVDVAETVTGLDIHYYGMVDISGLVSVIDLIGGVEVDVENAFTDYMFPSAQNTWETISFEAGIQHMDGDSAMKYARSRHAQSTEGSDFARARRQQKLILAIRDKVLSVETYTNPLAIVEIMEELGESIVFSTITTEDIRAGIALGNKFKNGEAYSTVLDPSIGNWTLIMEDPSPAYVLTPKVGDGNWEDIHLFISQLLENPALFAEKSTIYMYNGGLGYNETYQVHQQLVEAYPYLPITFGGNTTLQTYSGTNVYNFKGEPHIAALDELSKYFETEWASEIPEGLINVYGEDIVIILGIPEPEMTEETIVPTDMTGPN